MSITLDGSNLTTTGVINSGTAVASTSGTSIDFTGIPAGVKRVTVMFNGVSLNASVSFLVQIGSGSVTTTGYNSSACYLPGGTPTVQSSTAGFLVYDDVASFSLSGILTLGHVGSNVWVSSYTAKITTSVVSLGGGDVTLSGVLDRVRITSTNGTATFDAGSINILYE